MESTVSLSKGCFVFKNGHIEKSRKKSKKSQQSSSFLDTAFKSQKWYQTYHDVRESIDTQIQLLQAKNHEHLLNNIENFVRNSVAERPPRLPTVALLTGVNQPDHLDVFKILASKIRQRMDNNMRYVLLQARDCTTMKSAIESLVHGLITNKYDDDKEKVNDDQNQFNLPRSKYTFDVLKTWNNEFFLDQTPLLGIFIPDFELFNSNVLEDFLRLLSSNFPQIIFLLVLGIATEISTLHRTLPFNVTARLNLRASQAVPCKIGLANILENIILTPKCPINLSGRIFSLLTDIFLFHDMSITSFVQGFQYCVMEHYYQGNEYSLCVDYETSLENISALSANDLENIRRLPSFRPYVESFTNCKDVIGIFKSDRYFKDKLKILLQDAHIYFTYFYGMLRILEVFLRYVPTNKIGKELRDIYSICASVVLVDQADFQETWQLINFMSTEDLMKCLKESVLVLQEYSNKFCGNDFIGKECFDTLQIVISKLTKATKDLTMEKTNEAQIKRHKEKVLYFIKTKLFSTYLRPFSKGPPLLELFVYSNISMIRSRIMGTPRAALDTSLQNPQYYLQCDCCVLNNSSQLVPSMPDLSIAYKLHLECGHQINLYDWLQAFRAVLDDDVDDDTDVNAEIQARFARAVAELQFLGFIKSSKRKTDHVTRLTW